MNKINKYSYSKMMANLEEIAKSLGRDWDDIEIIFDINTAREENWEAYMDTRMKLI